MATLVVAMGSGRVVATPAWSPAPAGGGRGDLTGGCRY